MSATVLVLVSTLLAPPVRASEPAPEPVAEKTASSLTCRRHIGAAAGGFVAPGGGGNWTDVGAGGVILTASPVFAMTCDLRRGAVGLLFGGETAPWYAHRTWTGRRVSQWATATAGLTTGTEALDFGLVATYGFNVSGVGALLDWRPIGGPDQARRGFQVRVTAPLNGSPALQMMLLYSLSAHRLPTP